MDAEGGAVRAHVDLDLHPRHNDGRLSQRGGGGVAQDGAVSAQGRCHDLVGESVGGDLGHADTVKVLTPRLLSYCVLRRLQNLK